MQFNPINVMNGIVVALLLLPNLFYALRHRGEAGKRCPNRWMNLLEQVGRYGCILLMIFPMGVWEFGFSSSGLLVCYLIGNVILLVGYQVAWMIFARTSGKQGSLWLAVLPSCCFLLTGFLLEHWLLVVWAVLFGVAHCYVINNSK